MDKVSEIITSPVWWITVVIAGIVINLLSSYLRDALDIRLSRISDWWGARSQKRRDEKTLYIDRLKSDEKFLVLNSIRHTMSRAWAIMWSLMGIMAFLSAQIIVESKVGSIGFMAIGSVAFFRGFQHLLKAGQYLNYAEEAIDPENT